MKIIFIFFFLLLITSCENWVTPHTLWSENIKTINEIQQTTSIEPYQLWWEENCVNFKEKLVINLDRDLINEVTSKLYDHTWLYNQCKNNGFYTVPTISLYAKILDDRTINKLIDLELIQWHFDYNIESNFKKVESQEILYNYLKHINRNTTIKSIDVNIEDQSIEINEDIFFEILQNSRFSYSLNLNFEKSFIEIEILERMEKSNTQILEFNNYGRWTYHDDYYFRDESNDAVQFFHNWKKAEFRIDDWKEVFEYFDWPGSKKIPFNYWE